MICFYLANEGLSILENLAARGVPIPRRLNRFCRLVWRLGGRIDQSWAIT
ncbi:phage holin family protein [Acetobacterium malicum]